ncbi:MAG: hypothetical protein C5B50_01990 [Verrucomicrobia bacterium]|nr:MAG: hypothetical protein C5B50_01990 [Verrucomicrobiota bacterium]
MAEQEYRRRAYPLEFIPAGARERALAQTKAYESARSSPTRNPVSTWVSIGPSPIISPDAGSDTINPCDNVNGPTPLTIKNVNAVSGRVTALAVDPSNFYHWLLGAAQGGIWETTDAGNSWIPRTDDQASLASGSIAFSQSNPLIVYAGTGEPNFSADSYAGAGLLVSFNGGTNWQMCSTQFAESSISAVRVDNLNPTNLSVATVRGVAGTLFSGSPPNQPSRGVFVSTNGGGLWTHVLTGEATDLAISPYNFNQQYAALGDIFGSPTNGIYRTTNAWHTVEFMNGPWTSLAFPTNMGRIALAIAPLTSQVIYVAIAAEAGTGGFVGVWRSENAWSPVPAWTNVSSPSNVGGFLWYDLAISVDPNDYTVLYMAEFQLHRLAFGFWSDLGKFIHPDNHVLTWVPWPGIVDARLAVGNDGGVWFRDNNFFDAWFDLNNPSLAISQIYKGSVHPKPNYALTLAGTQDNGTAANAGGLTWKQVFDGDGADNAIASSNPDSWWAVCMEAFCGPAIYRTTDAGTNLQRVLDGMDFSPEPFFIHFEKSPHNDDIFIAGGFQLWYITNFFTGTTPSWTSNSPVLLDGLDRPVPISAVAFANSDPNSLTYAYGTEIGQLRITGNGGGSWSDLNPAGAVPGRFISGLAFSPSNPNILFVSLSGFDEGTPGHPGHVFYTTNAFASPPLWFNISPPVDIPMNCILVQSNIANITVGSDIGIWTTSSGGSTWTHQGPAIGMPNVAVNDLRMNSVNQITAFTHGRGAFTYVPGNPINIVEGPVFPIDIGCLECPPFKWVNPGDLLEIEVTLQNDLPGNTLNLVASILPSAQVTPVNGTQTYGALAGFGAGLTRSFSLRATGLGGAPSSKDNTACGSTIQVTFQFQDGTNNLGQVSVPFRLGTPFHPLSEIFDTTPTPALPPGWLSTASGLAAPWMTTSNAPPNHPVVTGSDGDVPDLPTSSNPQTNVSVFTPAVAGIGQSFLYTPPFVLTSSIAQVYFRQSFLVSNTYDGCILELSLAGGPFQELLHAGGSFAQNGYNRVLNDRNPLGPQPAWSGDSHGWLPIVANLPSAAAGQVAQLRWHFATSRGLTNGAWFVDSVAVTDPQCLPPISNPQIINTALTGGQFHFAINTVSNRTYQVQYKTNITDPTWQFLQSLSGNGATQTVTLPVIPPSRFFRFQAQ